MKKNYFYIICLLLLAAPSHAQKEANWWHFGGNNSLNFNNTSTVNDDNGTPTGGMPKAGTGNIDSSEGCFSISDKDGNLLMYGNGRSIWDKNGNVMPLANGDLLGLTSSSQSGVIVPYPGDPDKYYAMAVAADRGANGITYSIVDMTLRSGQGNVVNGKKNLTLKAGPADENVAVMKKKGSDNYWIINRSFTGTTGTGGSVGSATCVFSVWELTPAGFSAPVTYTVATSVVTTNRAHDGYLKFSADGKKFAAPTHMDEGILSGNFDPATGQISGLQYRKIGLTYGYTVEFSLSGNHLFITDGAAALYHISWDALRNTTEPLTNLNKSAVNIQMHPDGRIYGISANFKLLHVIMDPENGANAEIRTFTDYLVNIARNGLPTFAANFMMAAEKDFCINTSQDFSASFNSYMASAAYTVWNFGDGTAEITDTDISTGSQTHSHTYAKPGTYSIIVKVFDASDNLLRLEDIEAVVRPCVMPVNPNIHSY